MTCHNCGALRIDKTGAYCHQCGELFIASKKRANLLWMLTRGSFKLLSMLVLGYGIYRGYGYIVAENALAAPCGRPLEYSIGSVDPRFKISKDEFQTFTQQAGQIWSEAAGKPLFQYNPSATFTISLVDNSTQIEEAEQRALSQKIKEENSSIQSLQDQIQTLKEDYTTEKSQYESQIDYWNDVDGAPPDVYDKLMVKKYQLQNMIDHINNLVDQEHQEVNLQNTDVDNYNKKAGKEFKKGLYHSQQNERGKVIPRNIEIYQYDDKNDLKLTLAHEMGHYIGLEHVQDSEAIMTAVEDSDNPITPHLTDSDKKELNKVCKLQ